MLVRRCYNECRRYNCLHLDVAQLQLCRRVLVGNDNAQRDGQTQSEGDGCEEAKDILYPHERRMHLECAVILISLVELKASNCIAFT